MRPAMAARRGEVTDDEFMAEVSGVLPMFRFAGEVIVQEGGFYIQGTAHGVDVEVVQDPFDGNSMWTVWLVGGEPSAYTGDLAGAGRTLREAMADLVRDVQKHIEGGVILLTAYGAPIRAPHTPYHARTTRPGTGPDEP